MADRDKVIKGLEWILNDIEENGHYQVGYYADEIRDAIALLKEQEPKKPIASEDSNSFRRYNCPKCGRWFEFYKPAYCDKCGQAVKWE